MAAHPYAPMVQLSALLCLVPLALNHTNMQVRQWQQIVPTHRVQRGSHMLGLAPHVQERLRWPGIVFSARALAKPQPQSVHHLPPPPHRRPWPSCACPTSWPQFPQTHLTLFPSLTPQATVAKLCLPHILAAMRNKSLIPQPHPTLLVCLITAALQATVAKLCLPHILAAMRNNIGEVEVVAKGLILLGVLCQASRDFAVLLGMLGVVCQGPHLAGRAGPGKGLSVVLLSVLAARMPIVMHTCGQRPVLHHQPLQHFVMGSVGQATQPWTKGMAPGSSTCTK